jgi:predicted  nucleic acid-binding Zn-ribbon protein
MPHQEVWRTRGPVCAHNTYADAHTDSDTDAHTDSDTDAHTDSDTDAHTDSDTDAHTDSDADAHADADAVAHAHTVTDGFGGLRYAYGDALTHAGVNLSTWSDSSLASCFR